jgi:hypothetical protein
VKLEVPEPSMTMPRTDTPRICSRSPTLERTLSKLASRRPSRTSTNRSLRARAAREYTLRYGRGPKEVVWSA